MRSAISKVDQTGLQLLQPSKMKSAMRTHSTQTMCRASTA